MRNLRVFLLAGLFAIIGLSLMMYKHTVLEFPFAPNKTYNSWYLEARVDVASRNPWRPGDKPLLINMQLPHNTSPYAVVDENIVARGFGYEISGNADNSNRVAVFSKRRMEDKETIFYRATLYQLDSPASEVIDVPARPDSPYAKRNRPKVEDGQTEAPIYVAIDALIAEAREESASDRTFVREIFKLARDDKDDRVQLIRDIVDSNMTASELSALLLSTGDVALRSANGLKLSSDQRRAQFAKWLEVFIGDKWHAIDPETYRFGLEGKYAVWWYGDEKFLTTEGNASTDVSIAVRQNTNNALTRAIWKSGQLASVLMKFSFYNLPLDSQLVFKSLLMIPLGGLVLAVLRQVIGIKTFGTFMPVLIALAFRETGLITGILLFTMVVTIGLVIRNYFDHLKLLLVPRLAAVLTVVVIVLSFIAMITNELGLKLGLSIALFPIVILTMTIERMTLMWEEYGPDRAIKTGLQSMLAATLAYFAMSNELLGHLIFAFPELLLVVLALNLILGRYNNYKLTEYIRFQQLRRSLAALEKQQAEKKGL